MEVSEGTLHEIAGQSSPAREGSAEELITYTNRMDTFGNLV